MAIQKDLTEPMKNSDAIKTLMAIRDLANDCLGNLIGRHKVSRKEPKEKHSDQFTDPILAIVNKIKNCDEAERIEAEILDKTSIPGRVLLPFYICYKYFPEQSLTTGDVEKVTAELKVRVKTPNVSKAITDSLHKYLDGDSTRIRGKAVRYKLNRKGARYFESLIGKHE